MVASPVTLLYVSSCSKTSPFSSYCRLNRVEGTDGSEAWHAFSNGYGPAAKHQTSPELPSSFSYEHPVGQPVLSAINV